MFATNKHNSNVRNAIAVTTAILLTKSKIGRPTAEIVYVHYKKYKNKKKQANLLLKT